MNKKLALNIIGSIFLIWGIAAIIDNILKTGSGIAPLLWMSYICLIVIGIGILRKDSSLVASQVAIISIPYTLWNIDFFYQLFTGSNLLGIADYFFESGPLIGKIITFQHIFNLPLSIFSIYLIGLKKSNFWIISLMQVTIIFFISRAVTDPVNNVNCVYQNCANFDFGLWYPLEWFMAQLIMISIASWLLVKILRK